MAYKGPAVIKDAKRKWQHRIYLSFTWTVDLLPVWNKYYALNTRARSKNDRPSYSIKWLFIIVSFERVRMSMRE